MTVEIKEVSRMYQRGPRKIFALKDISMTLEQGKLVVVLGPSGSGKTTLLNVLGGIDSVTSGQIIVDGQEITKLSTKDLAKYRRDYVGFVFQFFNLLPIYTGFENVAYAVELSLSHKKRMTRDQLNRKVLEYLEAVDMIDKKDQFPSKMTGGEQQRIASARAFAKEPNLLLCDEPTGELSVEEGKRVLSVIQTLSKKIDSLIVLVTHNQEIAKIADLVVRLRSGSIGEISEQKPMDAMEISW